MSTKCDEHDEFHFLVECKPYKEVRAEFLNSEIEEVIKFDIEKSKLFSQIFSLEEEHNISAPANHKSEATKMRTEMAEVVPYSA